MKSIAVHTNLNAPADAVWATVRRPAAFVHAAGPILRYPRAERHPAPWETGEKLIGWLFLFRVIPILRYTIEIVEIDHASMTLLTEEHGGLLRTWRHTIVVEPLAEDRCRYEDRVDIEAGVLTAVVAGFARVFYRYRQRRWRKVAPLLAAASDATAIGH